MAKGKKGKGHVPQHILQDRLESLGSLFNRRGGIAAAAKSRAAAKAAKKGRKKKR